ncbi:MAG TPA: zf-HC2 domain-containing protein [Vicinamibacterales bacterium]
MTRQDETSATTCHAPVDPAVLADYWLGVLSTAEEEAVESHLFECDACGERLRDIIEIAEALRALAHSGALRVILGDTFIRHVEQTGRRVRQYDFVPGQIVPCTISADDDLLVARFAVDLSKAERVDLSFRDPQGVERGRMNDIPVRTNAGHVIFQESATFAKAAPSSSMVARLLAVGTDGEERLLGEYFFQHTRTISGPPGWE